MPVPTKLSPCLSEWYRAREVLRFISVYVSSNITEEEEDGGTNKTLKDYTLQEFHKYVMEVIDRNQDRCKQI